MLVGEKQGEPTYRVVRVLEEGATGIVQVVDHSVFGREMVQKTADTVCVPDSVAFQEPQLLDRVDHPRVVRVREAQPDPQYPHAVTMVMDYYPEGSVAGALRAGRRFGVRTAVQLACDVLDGLDHLHVVHGYAHRDVKTSNVLLDGGGTSALLTDLGSAARLGADGSCGAAGGTLLYRAPEYASGRLTVRSDLYGAGVLLLELLGGPLPTGADGAERMERALAAGRRAFPDRLVAFGPEVPDRVRTLVRGLLAVEPLRRPERASDAARLLRDARTVDWARTDGTDGTGLDGEWTGAGLPDRRGAVRDYRVTSRVLAAGADRGARKVSVSSRPAGGGAWRRVVPDSVLAADDERGLRDAFEAGRSHAFHR